MAKVEEIDFLTDTVIFRPAVEFIDVVRALHPFYFTLMIGAALMVAGIMAFVINVLGAAYAASYAVPQAVTKGATVSRKAAKKVSERGGRGGTKK
ncbi:MAG: hypothetical protein ACE5KK_02140 [Candidatus Brocadiales bacterium]